MKKKLFALITVLALSVCCAFSFTACNKNDDAKVVTVGYTLYEPMNYMEGNTLVGFDTDLAKAVFEDLGYTVVFKEISWENKYVDLNTGNISCIWNGFTSNSADDDGTQRSDKVDFSYNYMLNAQCVVINNADADTLKTAADFSGKRGYVEAGSAGETYAKDTLTGANVSSATKQMDAITQVNTKSAQFAVVDLQLAKSIVGKGDFSGLTIVESLNSASEYYAVGFKKGSDLTAKVNATLEKLAANGKIAEIAAKYNVSTSVITDFSSQK